MSLIERAKKDLAAISTNASSGFAVPITLIAPTDETITFNGLYTEHNMGIDTDGNLMNTLNSHISFPRTVFNDSVYPYIIDGVLQLKNHKVKVTDGTGTEQTYLINEVYPDNTLNFIVCILGAFVD